MRNPERCPYCKSDDTQRVMDFVELEPYVAHYKGEPFKVYECMMLRCRARWHWKVEAEPTPLEAAVKS